MASHGDSIDTSLPLRGGDFLQLVLAGVVPRVDVTLASAPDLAATLGEVAFNLA